MGCIYEFLFLSKHEKSITICSHFRVVFNLKCYYLLTLINYFKYINYVRE